MNNSIAINRSARAQTIADWPESERPREKLLTMGAQALSDAELLAIFLRTGRPGVTALDVARQLLVQHGELHGLLRLDGKTLCATKGVGSSRAATLLAALELGRRRAKSGLQRESVLQTPHVVQHFLQQQLAYRPQEVFGALFLDAAGRLIAFEELAVGTVNEARVYARELVRLTIAFGAVSLIVAHNHPSGVCSPSEADRLITERLRRALELVDVQLLDHFIVAPGVHYSFAQHGLL
jgi:DNA repair protein RadC